jgi:hypothetical protein
MPQDGLFFRVLRRFNMILVTIIALAVIGAVGWHVWKNPGFRHELTGRPAFVLPAPAAQGEALVVEPENYGTSDTVYGPHQNTVMVLYRYPPFAAPGKAEEYPNYAPKQAVNIMVLDAKNGDGHWLFPDNKQVIVMRDALYEGPAESYTTPDTDKRPVLGMVLMVAPADTNKNGMLDVGDAATLYAWTKGAAAAKALVAIDEMISVGQYDDHYIVVYKKGKDLKSATYSVPEFKLLADKVLPKAPK